MASCHTHAALQGGALVSSAPTKQRSVLPQNTLNSQKRLWENFALLVQLGQLHPLLGRCKKSIDFFVVTKFRCIFAM